MSKLSGVQTSDARTVITLEGVMVEKAIDGQVVLSIPVRELSALEQKVIADVFPNTYLRVCDLLATESLLAHVVPTKFN